MFSIFTNKVSKEETQMEITDSSSDISSSKPQGLDRAVAAVFYGATSLAVIFTNKQIMTGYNFPFFDFLAAVQFLATTAILFLLVIIRKVDIPALNYSIFREIFPISMMFLGNVICGLGSTRSLNLPMFTALRRFSILMTMMAEYFILSNRPSNSVIISVILMVGGALFAAAYDLSFNGWGYTLVFLNNGFTTLNGVWLKKASMSGKCNKMGILFYNSLFSAVAMFFFFAIEHYNVSVDNNRYNSVLISTGSRSGLERRHLKAVENYPNDNSTMHNIFPLTVQTHGGARLRQSAGNLGAQNELILARGILQSTVTKIFLYDGWRNLDFLFIFMLAALLGSVLNYSIFVCTTINSALTTAVVGCLKNVVTTYIGMMIFTDYAFNWWNFAGINISIIGSLYYTYVTMLKGAK